MIPSCQPKLPSAPSKIPSKVKPGQKVEWTLPSEGMSVHDPQGVFEQFRIDNATLRGYLSKATGERTFFLCNEQSNSMAPIELNIGVPAKPKCKPLVLQGQREHLPLTGKFNSDNIPSKNWWCSDPMVLDLSQYTVKNGNKSFLTAGDYKFEVLPTG
ncbi:MAG: hypothetical protein ABFD54_17375 [Armatimonadota bacterium]